MNIRYIYGNSGSGKSSLCINEIYEKSKTTTNNLIYIVPEQFTLQSEKRLVEKIPSGVMLGINVLSFKRLAHTLFNETGLSSSKILGDVGKLMLLRKITYEHYKELPFFKSSIDKYGFLENVSKQITEFFKYDISVKTLEDNLENLKEKNTLYDKMKDLILIYKEYIKYLQTEYISTDETLDLLANKIKSSDLIKNSEIWIDEFSGFTPQEFKVIKELFQYAKQINITFCLNTKRLSFKDINIFDPFYEIKTTVNRLNSLGKEANAIFLPHTYLDTNIRQNKNKEFYHLQKNFLSLKKKEYKATPENIIITKTSTKYSEINILASNILSLVRDKNYYYKDIAVILGDETYKSPIKSIFKQYDIPFFIDTKNDIAENRITELVCSFFEMLINNMNYESVFRFLKTYLTPLEYLDVSKLENYVLQYGIKGKKWFAPKWDFGFTDEKEKYDINYFKDCFIDCLKPFTEYIKIGKKYTIKEISFRLYNFLTGLELEKILDYEKEPDCFQVYGIIMDLLDKMVEILGDEKVTISEYSKILNSGIKSSQTGHLPQNQDEVIIGDLKRTRLSDIKALFILSLNDGVLPAIPSDNDIFSDDDKIYMNSKGIEFSPTSFFQISQDNFLLYTMFSKPTEKLYLSYVTTSSDGKEKRESRVISSIKKIFINLKEKTDKLTPLEKITLPSPTFSELTLSLAEYANGIEFDDIYKDLYNIFSSNKNFDKKLKRITTDIFDKKYEDTLPKETIAKLYGKELYSSVTKLEKYASCPFSYFMNYGLQAQERKIYDVSGIEVGSIYHKILEDISKYLNENNLPWKNLSQDMIDKLIGCSIDTLMKDTNLTIFESSNKYKFMLNNIKQTASKSVNALSNHLGKGNFKPFEFEIGFGKKYKLPAIIIELNDNTKLLLTGKIDRIDVLTKDGISYIKILDYKTGNKTYSIEDVYYGLQLQLLIYLDAFIKKGEKLTDGTPFPAGIFYFKIQDPTANLDDKFDVNDEEKLSLLFKEFKMNGLAIDDIDILNNIDNISNAPKKISNIFTFSITAKGEINAKQKDNFVNLEQFKMLMEYVITLAKQFGNEIISGNIKVNPYKKLDNSDKDKESSCTYCNYSAICQIDVDERENTRIFKKLPAKTALQKIEDYLNNN